jgi:hypothetical protein
MATLVRRALTAVGDSLRVNCAGLTKVGFGVTGNWAGTLQFSGTVDGLTFKPIYLIPYPPGTGTLPTGVNTVTANGNLEFPAENYVAITAQLTALTSAGGPLVSAAASNDTSYQDAFQASTSNYVSQQVGGGAVNSVTIAAQANRALRCRTLTYSFSAAPAGPVLITIYDGGSSNVLWQEYANVVSTSLSAKLNLPSDWNTPYTTGGGVVGSIGNSMQITIAAPGGTITSILNAEMAPA